MSSNRISSHLERSALTSAVKNIHNQYYVFNSTKNERFKNKGTQTDLRENECQTLPWEPAYTIKPGHAPEVLEIADIVSNFELPGNMHEIDVINRFRMKKAWEGIFPPMDSPCNIKMCSQLISALEADKWSFREAEIEFVMQLRMELAEAIEQSKESDCKRKTDIRLKRLEDRLIQRKSNEIQSIRGKLSKELRKLAQKRQESKPGKENSKYRNNICERLTSGPRYSCNSNSANYLLEQEITLEKDFSSWIRHRPVAARSIDSDFKKICPRVQERNEWKILKLREKPISSEPTISSGSSSSSDNHKELHFLRRNKKIVSLLATPSPSPRTETSLEDAFDSGELLVEDQSEFEELEECESISQDAEENEVQEILKALEGKTVSSMLTHLSDELVRLQDEKRMHAMLLLTERERMKREIEELREGKLEMNRRQELDRIFGGILKVNEQSVDDFLRDIVDERIESISTKEAEKQIREIACQVETESSHQPEDAFVSDMFYNVVLAEAKKQSLISEEHLHGAVHEEISNLPLANSYSSASATSSSRSDRLTSQEQSIEYLADHILSFVAPSLEEFKPEISALLREMLHLAKQRLSSGH